MNKRQCSKKGVKSRQNKQKLVVHSTTSLHLSVVKQHLPDPPEQDLDSDRVNSSKEAFSSGTPDSPLSIVSHAINIALETAGGEQRAQKAPWLAIAATLATLPAAITAGQYLFYQMPVKETRWCGYCMGDALAHIATTGFTLFGSVKALSHLKRKI